MKKTWISAAIACALVSMGAEAQSVDIKSGETYEEDFEAATADDSFSNSGTVTNSRIILNGGSFQNYENARIETGVLVVQNNGQNIFKGIISTNEFEYLANGGGYAEFSSILTASQLKIANESASQAGLKISDKNTISNVESLDVVNNGGGRTRLQINAEKLDYQGVINLNANQTAGDAALEFYTDNYNNAINRGTVTLAKVVSNTVSGGSAFVQMNTAGSLTIGDLQVESGKLNLQTIGVTSGYHEAAATFNLSHIAVGPEATLRLAIYGSGDTIQRSAIAKGETINIDLSKGASIDFGGWNKASDTEWRPDLITIDADEININIADSDSNNFVYFAKKTDGSGLQTNSENIHVIAADANNTGDAIADLEKLAEIVKTNYKDANKQNHPECLPGVQLEQQASDLYDAAYGEVGEGVINEAGDCINCGVTNVRTVANPNVNGIAEMTTLGLHVWRNEIDDMHRRLGELRDSSADANGLWTRIYNGKASFGGQDITNKYTAFQFGYDHQVTPGFWLGGAMSYTYGDNDFRYGGGDSNLLAFTGYGSWLWDSGIYLDVTGKIGRMKNSFDIALNDIRSSGNYHTNAVSISAELGWRFYPLNNVFVEPQLEMWYGHVFDAQYETSTGVSVDQASTESLVGRAGVKLGIKCPNNRGSAFIKASVLHDWQGDADFRFGKSGAASRTISEELGGTWYEYGIGADLNATNQLHFWADLERGEGGEVDTDYRVTVGMRYSY